MKKKEPKVVATVPAPKRAKKYNINWDAFADTARLLGQPVLAGENIRETQAKAIRLYNREPFVTSEGRILVQLRNSEVKSDGVRYGDVYFTWQPNTTTETTEDK